MDRSVHLKKSMQQGQYTEGPPRWIASLLCILQLQYKYIQFMFGIKTNRCKAVPVHTIKAYMGGTVIAQFILNLGTRQKWVLSFPQLMLYPQGKKCNAHWIAGCVGSQPVCTFCEERKIFSICQDMKLGSSSPQPNHYTNYTITAAHKLTQISVHRNITWDSAQSECGHVVMQYSITQEHFLWCLGTRV
jgi:hypothetical protein